MGPMEDCRELNHSGDRRVGDSSWRAQGLLPAAEVLHPTVLLALVLLGLNDHVLKEHVGGFVTGKLSDFAGVYSFPFLLTALWNTGRFLGARLRGVPKPICRLTAAQAVVATAVTATGFSLVQTSRGAADLYVVALGKLGFPSSVTMDPWDLTALAVVPLVVLRFRAEIASRQ